jgi:uncharacterized protein YecE (DUF72 family)
MGKVKVGCSGFFYDHCKDEFYPPDISRRMWFNFYSSSFDSLALNVTFYRLPGSSTFRKWYEESPAGYSLSIKGSRCITHVKRQRESEGALRKFFERATNLRDKLSVVLWQFPRQFACNLERLRDFLLLVKGYPVRILSLG